MNLFDDQNKTDQQPNFVVGNVSAIFFTSPDSFYKVLLVKISETSLDWHEDEIVVIGNFAEISEETTYRFVGKQVSHPKYGTQFQADNYENETPTSKTGIISYLSGDDFPGLGKKTAERIVDLLGLQAIDKIIGDPECLAPLNLKPKVREVLIENLTANNGMDQIVIGLNSYGFGSQLTAKIFEKYRGETLDVLKENPYQLVEDIVGINFKRADRVANQIGIKNDDPKRVRAALLQTIEDLSMQDGDVYTTAKPLMQTALQLLEDSRQTEINPQLLAEQLVSLAKEQKVVGDHDRIYLKQLYDAEWQIAEHLNRLLKDEALESLEDSQIEKQLRIVGKQLGITYDDSQKGALTAAINSRVFLLTGGPGTGKTTIINGLVNLYGRVHNLSLDINEYKDKPFPVLLAAPTGRAAKRMSETTGLPASTIHRLLGLTGREQNPDVETNELEGGLLIVDEMSMVDEFLFQSLLKAIPSRMQVVLVGDKDQLPSVGPGQVFHDLLASGEINKIELTTIYRQGDGSSIIPLAHSIKEGKLPSDFTVNQADRSFIPCGAGQIDSVISQIVSKAKVKGFDTSDIQVLAPMYRGVAGIDRLNETIQEIMNPHKNSQQKEVEFRGQKFRIGDKVLHLVNSPENNVFNGDIGIIVGIDLASDKANESKSDQITIAFDQTEVTYGRNDWIRITLAYCTSIHKSQGSEFKMVILPMVPQYARMLQRNLLYTAVTRAEKMLILLGDADSFRRCVENQSVNRKTTLKERLQSVIDDQPKESVETEKKGEMEETPSENISEASADTKVVHDTRLSEEMILSGKIDPMIGMNGISPQEFMPKRA